LLLLYVYCSCFRSCGVYRVVFYVFSFVLSFACVVFHSSVSCETGGAGRG
jgi:hypothetical protein